MANQRLRRTLILVLVIAGCGEAPVVERVNPVTPPPAGVTLRVAVTDAGLASALGWAGGAVPRAEVTFWSGTTDDGDTSPVTPATGLVRREADGSGAAQIGPQTAGDYRAGASRILTSAERATLANTQWRNVVGVAAVGVVRIGTNGSVAVADPESTQPVADAPLLAVPMRQGGLVLAQWFFGEPRAFGGQYHGGKYFTLYNNSDTTIYLDGIIVGTGLYEVLADYATRTCAQSAPIRLDPAGMWTRDVAKFPGSGRNYPLLGGRGVQVAIDAIDHRGATMDLLFDLRGADFEYLGPTDVDNPAVPNMVPIQIITDQSGRGMNAAATAVVSVWTPQNWEALPKLPDTFDGRTRSRLPISGKLDVAAFKSPPGSNPPGTNTYTYCEPWISQALDRQVARLDLKGHRPTIASYRKIAVTLPNGRVVLQNTGTSSQDFYTAAPDPLAPPLVRQ